MITIPFDINEEVYYVYNPINTSSHENQQIDCKTCEGKGVIDYIIKSTHAKDTMTCQTCGGTKHVKTKLLKPATIQKGRLSSIFIHSVGVGNEKFRINYNIGSTNVYNTTAYKTEQEAEKELSKVNKEINERNERVSKYYP